ncbi:transposase [Spirosoma endbachense]|uniref:Transposase n=1 Tax=Spirosoma endbachense TaxID=2666025 RepID=A0A6P1VV57_9BACT|nr:transposase [Spirosoma endbachense]QHV95637.1 transposase [Spirosoma endbachense]
MTHPLLAKCKPYFTDIPEHILQTMLLVCSAIVLARSTNLNILKDYLPQLLGNAKTKPFSHYKRLVRFFRWSEPNQLIQSVLRFIFRFLEGHCTYLIMDATTWQVGKKKVHLLTLCILLGKTAIPIYWLQLAKKGHSNEEERKQLFKEALERYDLKGKILLADREYIGETWFAFLVKENIDFVIRLPEGCYKLPIGAAPGAAYSNLCRQARWRKRGVIKPFTLNGCLLSVVVLKNPQADPAEPLLFFISSLTHKIQISEAYRLRWRIEVCFKQLKSQGFNLEDLNFKKDSKILLVMALVVMVYVLSLQAGFAKLATKQKTYRNGKQSLVVSLFRQGLSVLRSQVKSLKQFMDYLEKRIQTITTGKWLYVQ